MSSSVSVVDRKGGGESSGPEVCGAGPSGVLEAASPTPGDGGAVLAATKREQSLWRAALTIATLSGLTFTSSITTGLLTIALPRMAADLALTDSLLLWPASIYG